jgi:hypothetical protein
MGANRTSFEKLQRDRAKKAKAAAKRDKRLNGPPADEVDMLDPALSDPSTLVEGEEIPAEDLLRMVAAIHEQFEAGTLSFEDFEERKADLFARISVS